MLMQQKKPRSAQIKKGCDATVLHLDFKNDSGAILGAIRGEMRAT
jgi:hypothetical protein